MRTRRPRPALAPQLAFAGFRYPPEVIVLAVRWYLRFGLSYRDVEELLAERGVEVDHVTIYRWVRRFTPLLADAARPCCHLVGNRWFVDETYEGRRTLALRLPSDRPVRPGRRRVRFPASGTSEPPAGSFKQAIGATKVTPAEVITDHAPVYPSVLKELLPAAWHRTKRYGNNPVECDHGRLKARLRPMRGLKQDRNATAIIAGMPSSRTSGEAIQLGLHESRG